MKLGLQVCFGDLIGAGLLSELRAMGCQIIRIDTQRSVDLAHIAAMAREVTDAGMEPCTIINDAALLAAIPDGQIVEFGNEPDLGAQFGWPDAAEYIRQAREAATLDAGRHRLFIGVISNLNTRGFRFLESMEWASIPAHVGCAFHRYPDGDSPQPATPSRERRFRGPDHRDREVAELRRIVGDRPLILSEVGYHTANGLSEDQQAAHMVWERAFWARHGIEIAVAYQINSGPDPREVQHQYGFRRIDGSWRPVAAAWFGDTMPVTAGPTMEEFEALVRRVDALEAAGQPPEPPVPEPPTQVCRILVMDPNAQPIADVIVATEVMAGLTDASGLVTFKVTGSQLYGFNKDGWKPTTRDLPPWTETHRVHLEPEQAQPPTTQPPSGSFIAPIRGYLRRGVNATWGDDGGPRSIRGCSCFPLVRWMHDKPDFARAQLDRMVGRYQLVRVFWHLAHPQAWVPMNASVSPLTDGWFDEAFVRTLNECWARDLRVNLTAGDLQYLPGGTDLPKLYRRIAGLCKGVNEQVVALTEVVNEARVNSSQGEDWPFWAGLSREFQGVYPWGQHCTSDPAGQEEPAALRAAARSPSTCVSIHGTRQGSVDAIRRAFNLRYEGVGDIPIAETEPNGIDTGEAPGVYEGTASHPHIFGLYAAKILTGQLLIHFDSAGLGWHHYPIDREWGFHELPQRWQAMGIPDDIGAWKLMPGHRGEAPITIEGIPGTGSARCDTVTAPDGSKGYALVYGQTAVDPSRWRIVARQACQGALWEADGDPKAFTTGGGRFADEPSGKQVIVVEWHR
jgi:hypothetical protein